MKVFCIGLHKTGTTSLHRAFLRLGLRSRHYFPDEVSLDQFDCFSDLPIPLMYKELDRRSPGSKFILTTREKSAWLASCRRWFLQRPFADPPHVQSRLQECYGIETFDEEAFSRVYDNHHREVREYFRSRPNDLLEYSVVDGPHWEPLCHFLGLPVPKFPFPHANEFRPPTDTRIAWIRRVESLSSRLYWDIAESWRIEESIRCKRAGIDPDVEEFLQPRRMVRYH